MYHPAIISHETAQFATRICQSSSGNVCSLLDTIIRPSSKTSPYISSFLLHVFALLLKFINVDNHLKLQKYCYQGIFGDYSVHPPNIRTGQPQLCLALSSKPLRPIQVPCSKATLTSLKTNFSSCTTWTFPACNKQPMSLDTKKTAFQTVAACYYNSSLHKAK